MSVITYGTTVRTASGIGLVVSISARYLGVKHSGGEVNYYLRNTVTAA